MGTKQGLLVVYIKRNVSVTDSQINNYLLIPDQDRSKLTVFTKNI